MKNLNFQKISWLKSFNLTSKHTTQSSSNWNYIMFCLFLILLLFFGYFVYYILIKNLQVSNSKTTITKAATAKTSKETLRSKT